jgi:transposase
MSNCTRYLGLDVHAETITAAIAEGRGRIRSLGKFPNRSEAVRKLIEKLGGAKNLKVCYEAGPTGYALYWQLTKLGVDCEMQRLYGGVPRASARSRVFTGATPGSMR